MNLTHTTRIRRRLIQIHLPPCDETLSVCGNNDVESPFDVMKLRRALTYNDISRSDCDHNDVKGNDDDKGEGDENVQCDGDIEDDDNKQNCDWSKQNCVK